MAKLSDFVGGGGGGLFLKATANGSINAQDVVALRSDGDTEQVVESQSQSQGTVIKPVTGGIDGPTASTYDDVHNFGFIASCDENNGREYFHYVSASGTTLTVESGTSKGSGAGFVSVRAAHRTGTNQTLVALVGFNNYKNTQVDLFTTDGSSITRETSNALRSTGSSTSTGEQGDRIFDLVYVDSVDRFVVFWYDGNASSQKYTVIQVKDDDTITAHTEGTYGAPDWNAAATYNKEEDRVVHLDSTDSAVNVSTLTVGTSDINADNNSVQISSNTISGDENRCSIAYLESPNYVIGTYKDNSTGDVIAVPINVSGSTLNIGNLLNMGVGDYNDVSYDVMSRKAIAAWDAGSELRVAELSINWPDINKSNEISLLSGNYGYPAGVSMPTEGIVMIAMWDEDNADTNAIAYQAVTTNADNWIGVSPNALSDNEAGEITVGGVVSGFSGLMPNSTYYLNADGTIGTAETPYKLGRAIASDTILLSGIGSRTP